MKKKRVIRWSVDACYTKSWIEEKRFFFGFEYWVKIVKARKLEQKNDVNEQIFNLMCTDTGNYQSYWNY